MDARSFSHRGLRIYEERYLEWEGWGFPGGIVLAGRERFAQLVWLLEVKPTLLETDPGPLDARVP